MQTDFPAQLKAITTLYGHKILVDPGNTAARKTMHKGVYDHPSIDLLRNILSAQRCRTILDIGANIGNHSLAFSQLCARLLAFEPRKLAFEILKNNIDRNNLRNIRALNFGLSNVEPAANVDVDSAAHVHPTSEATVNPGIVTDTDTVKSATTTTAATATASATASAAIVSAADTATTTSTYAATATVADAVTDAASAVHTDIAANRSSIEQAGTVQSLHRAEATGTTELKAGDAYLKSQLINDVDFIKINANGHEQRIFEGLETTLRRCRPLVLVEWNSNDTDRLWITDKEIKQNLFSDYQVFALIWNTNKHYWSAKPLGGLRRSLIRIFRSKHKRLAPFDPVGHQTQVNDLLLVPREKLPCVSQYVYR